MKKLKRTFAAMLAFLVMMSCCSGMNLSAYAAGGTSGNPDDVTLYPKTPNAEQASDYTMTINGKEVCIEDFYKASQARVIHNGQGSLDVTVTVKNSSVKLTTCDVYPRRANVYPVMDKEAKTVSFTITPEMLEDNYQYIKMTVRNVRRPSRKQSTR